MNQDMLCDPLMVARWSQAQVHLKDLGVRSPLQLTNPRSDAWIDRYRIFSTLMSQWSQDQVHFEGPYVRSPSQLMDQESDIWIEKCKLHSTFHGPSDHMFKSIWKIHVFDPHRNLWIDNWMGGDERYKMWSTFDGLIKLIGLKCDKSNAPSLLGTYVIKEFFKPLLIMLLSWYSLKTSMKSYPSTSQHGFLNLKSKPSGPGALSPSKQKYYGL